MSDLWFWIITAILAIPMLIWNFIKNTANKVSSLFKKIFSKKKEKDV